MTVVMEIVSCSDEHEAREADEVVSRVVCGKVAAEAQAGSWGASAAPGQGGRSAVPVAWSRLSPTTLAAARVESLEISLLVAGS